jgi:ribosomal protein S18 acetylase RimI-like enzyme/adenylylsulfate kinase-like enzyme
MAELLILTGPPGSGKSSVAQALADRYDRVAHVDVDSLRHLITPTGYRAPGKPGFERQHALAVRNACDLARNFMAERFAVIIDDVLPSRADLDQYIEALEPAGVPVHFVRLLPGLEVCRERNRGRKADRVPDERLQTIYREFEAGGETRGSVIDSSGLSVEATADRLQALTTSGESIVWRPEAPAGPVESRVEVRSREPADDAWAQAMLAENWGSTRVVSRGRIHDAMSLLGFVALLDGRIAGLATYRVDGRECELVTLDSSEEQAGVSTALIEAVKDAARQRGCARVWLITTNDNTHALRFYQRRGFRIVAAYPGAVDASRRLKPEISALGLDGIPIRDELELELDLS